MARLPFLQSLRIVRKASGENLRDGGVRRGSEFLVEARRMHAAGAPMPGRCWG